MTLKNDQITLKGASNALLPTLDGYVFYGSSGLGGSQSPEALNFFTGTTYPPGAFRRLATAPCCRTCSTVRLRIKASGFTLTVPLRNRTAQPTRSGR